MKVPKSQTRRKLPIIASIFIPSPFVITIISYSFQTIKIKNAYHEFYFHQFHNLFVNDYYYFFSFYYFALQTDYDINNKNVREGLSPLPVIYCHLAGKSGCLLSFPQLLLYFLAHGFVDRFPAPFEALRLQDGVAGTAPPLKPLQFQRQPRLQGCEAEKGDSFRGGNHGHVVTLRICYNDYMTLSQNMQSFFNINFVINLIICLYIIIFNLYFFYFYYLQTNYENYQQTKFRGAFAPLF